MAVFDSAEDSEYYNVTAAGTLLEHATPTASTTHFYSAFDGPTAATTTPSSPYPSARGRACDIPLGQLC